MKMQKFFTGIQRKGKQKSLQKKIKRKQANFSFGGVLVGSGDGTAIGGMEAGHNIWWHGYGKHR